MKLTNKYNLPRVFEIIGSRDEYTRGKSHRSVTQLIDSPRVVNLRIANDSRVIEDVSELYFSIMGHAVHAVLEKAAEAEPWHIVTEQRFYGEMDNWTISGAIDVQQYELDPNEKYAVDIGVELQDYKNVSVWAVLNSADKPEWEAQLNIYHWLYQYGISSTATEQRYAPVTALKVVCLIRDWNRRDSKTREGYPPSPIHAVDIPIWDNGYLHSYIRQRILQHKSAAADMILFPDKLIACTENDMWVKETKYAVFSGNNKRASKVFDREDDAEAWMKDNPKLKQPYIDTRHGEPTRCVNNFCGVSEWCDQFKTQNPEVWKEQYGKDIGRSSNHGAEGVPAEEPQPKGVHEAPVGVNTNYAQ